MPASPAFSPTPSLDPDEQAEVRVVRSGTGRATALGVLVGSSGSVPAALGIDRRKLTSSGFTGAAGETLVIPTASPVLVAVGIGAPAAVDATVLRTAGAAVARAAAAHSRVAVSIEGVKAIEAATATQAIVEGALLARYRYNPLRTAPKGTALSSLVVVEGDEEGARRGRAFAAATSLARDLANTPHSHLNASQIADIAVKLGRQTGLKVEVFDEKALVTLGCGGLLGVNAGSAQPPRMIKLTYKPKGTPSGRLTFVGKGIMYDSGGLALKPGDEVHAQMKNDMSGAAAVLAAMSQLAAVDGSAQVVGYLMCTDNMPSGTAMALGDVLTIRGGKTVEVINTDAEGRLVMADALVLATEEPTDAIVDIATLTGACMRALGTQIAGVMGNDQHLVDRIREAAEDTDESVWQLPLDRRYRAELDSTVADMRNLGGANAGAITAALFLAEFVGDTPWAHVDIAGTAQSPGDVSWQTAGCSGFGARLLLQLAASFKD
ncbi:MAG TPA: leucyl aminopeptidase [Acidimicrobiales bacterium]|nr:leucyl aminopeptidase [Acidimicrobiales bacterium]